MTKVSSPAAYLAVAAAFSLLGIGVWFPVDGARADTCAAAPNAAAPEGQHWYYRSDRANHRKCWYLHATVRLPHHAMIQSADAAAEPAEAAPAQQPAAPVEPARAASKPQPSAAPAASPAANAPTAAGQPDSAQPAPHVTVLAVRTVNTPFVGTTPTPPQHAPENVSTPPMPQTPPSEESTAANDVKPADAAASAPLPPVPEAVRHELAKTIDATNATTRMTPATLFLLLAIALGLATIAIVIGSKIASRRRAPRLSDDPDTAWIRYRAAHQRYDEGATYEDVPFVDPRGQHGLANLHEQDFHEQDLHKQDWDDRPSAEHAEYPPARSEDGDPAPPEVAAPTLRDIELALRILRQARQSRVA